MRKQKKGKRSYRYRIPGHFPKAPAPHEEYDPVNGNLPNWLHEGKEFLTEKSCKARSIKYYRQVARATPFWAFKEKEQILAVYENAALLREQGLDVVVDHIVPLNSPIVCGLVCLANLQISERKANASKSNKWWPDAPFEQMELL